MLSKRTFALNEAGDIFIKSLAEFARANFIPAYLTGLSALTRITDSPAPEVEFVSFNTIGDVNLFCEQMCKNERNDFLSEGAEGLTNVSFAGKSTLICVKSRLHQFVGSDIELITIDARSGIADDDEVVFNSLDQRVCKWMSNPASDPTSYWRVFLTTGYLKGFSMPDVFCASEYICGNVPDSPLFRFPKVSPYELNHTTYGARVITSAIVESLGKINFQMDALFAMHDQLLNIELFEAFEDRYFENIPQMYENLKSNMEFLQISDVRTARMAIIMMPMYLYAKEKEPQVLKFMEANPYPQEFDEFVKMSGVHQIEYNRCPFIAWFFLSRHCFPSWLIFDAVAVCSAWFQLGSGLAPAEWVFVEAATAWRDAIALTPPQDCARHLDAIHRSGVLSVLNDPLVSISNNELQKSFGMRGMNMSVAEMKIYQLQFLLSRRGSSLSDFRRYIQRDPRFQNNMQTQQGRGPYR